MTKHQAVFLKTQLDIYLSKYEHLVDNEASVDFAKQNSAVKVFYMDNTHYFGKSEAVISELSKNPLKQVRTRHVS